MSRKSEYSPEEKIKACTEYLSGAKSATDIASKLNMGKNGCGTVRLWAKKYKYYGGGVFHIKPKNGSYSAEFKKNVVEEYLSEKGTLRSLSIKYNIPANSSILTWVKRYNSHIELKDYDPKPEVYMADTLKTTLEERIDIVKDCLAHDRDIKGTAAKYGCKYAQLYQWVRKYEVNGEDSLVDKRGKNKQEAELSEIEKAERKIAQLVREKEEFRKKYELLKKAEERERW
jgi:transposase-like protein